MTHCTPRRHWLGWAAAAALLAGAPAYGQKAPVPPEVAAFPNKVVKLVMPFPAGGAGDILARILADGLTHEWKQQVIVENKAGASGIIGNNQVAKSAPDGYTLLLTITYLVQAPSLGVKLPYDVLKDFTPLTRVADAPSLLVTTDPEITSVKRYVELASTAPGKYSYGTYGTGTTSHIYAELFNKRNGIQGEAIAYKGAAPLLQDMLGRQLGLSFVDLATSLPYIKAGKMRAHAVVGTKRSPLLPDVPTFTELGYPGLEVVGWYGAFAPAGMPPALADKIRTAIEKVVRQPETRQRILDMGLAPASGAPENFQERILSDLVNWRRVVQQSGISLE